MSKLFFDAPLLQIFASLLFYVQQNFFEKYMYKISCPMNNASFDIGILRPKRSIFRDWIGEENFTIKVYVAMFACSSRSYLEDVRFK